MITYQGVPVYPGVAIGKFSVVVSDRVGAQKRVAITQEQVGAELARLDSAFRGANKTLEEKWPRIRGDIYMFRTMILEK